MGNTSQWSKDVRKALIDRDMTMREFADMLGYSAATVSSVIHGRYSNASYRAIVRKINEALGTEGMPGRSATPSDDWCREVKIGLAKKGMSVKRLAELAGVTRNRMSLVINGKMMNGEIVSRVNEILGISSTAVSTDAD